MTNVQDFFKNLNDEMALYDPHKWLLDIEPEDIPEVVVELETDILNLEEETPDGDINNLKHWKTMQEKSITYKRECIEILTNIYNDYKQEVDY